MAGAASGQSDCRGKVGGYAYDLTPLAQKLGAVDLQTQDTRSQNYYYRVCGVVSNNFCQTVDDMTPAVCQKDSRIPAEFHDLGNQKTATFSSLPNRPDDAGFTLSYSGGQDGRASKIDFVCDPSKDPGEFSFLQEDPIKTYDLQYVSNPSLSPNPVPPCMGSACCLYQFGSDPTMTRTLCAPQCQPSFGGFTLIFNWTMSPCTSDTCFFHKKK
ncbi:uncharacterized protein ACA1_029530 [Acanthamoeba castellanii str. Neff]|uniref:MRH domain-containing protein n=1 Tax=Acanthamoeba castellanii (strain ATCC 30010 / Neff) TaxID=1257118 RepID=L8H8N2_ACACF|nr:uncharacterized protein ACA1_029530 [Acanthamoeba castellanii str. Neff]ELR21874.1 hypothetical protein ACA1_029530 [Acanthamoeba castellanii str. Neff]